MGIFTDLNLVAVAIRNSATSVKNHSPSDRDLMTIHPAHLLFSNLLTASGLVASEAWLAITDSKMLVREKLGKEFVHLKRHKDAILHLSFYIGFGYFKLFWNSTNLC